ncbi:MAG: PilZ domain-containing protein [Acidobacteriota bacterium]|nr:PilZ domain-containing protein [Acidobacteriota bacterium]
MTDKRSKVLLAGLGRGPFEALAPVLDRQKLEVIRVAAPKNSIELAHSEPFDLVILDAGFREGTLEQVVDAIRHGMSASRNTSILVLARPGQVDAVRNLVGLGVNRVMLLDDSPELIGQQVAELLNIAPRADLRFSTHLQTSVGDGAVEVLGEVVNLSATGMLVETATSFEPGEQVVVTINLGGQQGTVSAKAEVVRRAHNDRGGIDGIGVRFLSFARDGKEKIEAVLNEAFADPLIN